MKIWAADGERGLCCIKDGKESRSGENCLTLCSAMGRIFCAGPQRGFCLRPVPFDTVFDFPVPPGVCSLTGLGERIFALSADADCVCAYDGNSGEMLLSAPTGSYPRDVCPSPCGRYLAVAGGGAGEILIFDRALSCISRKKTAGVPCAVCFLPGALAVLCAVGDGDELSSRLLFFSPRGVEEEIFSFPAPPCSLCPGSGGHCLVGCQERVFCLKTNGKIAWCRPCAWPARIRKSPLGPLICDAWQGEIKTVQGKILYQGKEPLDVCTTT